MIKVLDTLYRDRDYARFFVLETIARVPYFGECYYANFSKYCKGSVLRIYKNMQRNSFSSKMNLSIQMIEDNSHLKAVHIYCYVSQENVQPNHACPHILQNLTVSSIIIMIWSGIWSAFVSSSSGGQDDND